MDTTFPDPACSIVHRSKTRAIANILTVAPVAIYFFSDRCGSTAILSTSHGGLRMSTAGGRRPVLLATNSMLCFYCREGNHESVAIAQGLRSWLRQKENVDVILCRTSEKEHRRLFCDPCMWCRMPRDRTEWEVKLVLDALHGRKSLYS